MLAGRALQGVAMGYIPVAISMVREVSPPHVGHGAVAAVSATLGVGGALGLPLSAWIARGLRLARPVLALDRARRGRPRVTAVVRAGLHDEHPAQLDVVGAIGLAVGLCSVLSASARARRGAGGAPHTSAPSSAASSSSCLWGSYELRHHDPLVDLRTTARRPVLFTNLAAVLIGFGMMAQAIVVPQLLEMPTADGLRPRADDPAGRPVDGAGRADDDGCSPPSPAGCINAVGARITLSRRGRGDQRGLLVAAWS